MNQAKAKAGWLVVSGLVVCAGLQAQTGQTVPAAPAPAPLPVVPAGTPVAPAATPTLQRGPVGGAKSDAKVTVTPAAGISAPPGGPQPGQALDRVIAVVNGDLVLESDVDEERRMAVLQPVRDPSGEFSREQAIERLINRALILQQAKLQAQTAISDADVNAELVKLRDEVPECKAMHCETAAGWARFLREHDLTQAEVIRRWRERMQVLQYIELRFRGGVRITPRETRDYYEKTMLPEYEKRGVKPPGLDAVSQRIEEVLLQQTVTSLLQDWLKSLRAQGSVQTMTPGEMAP